MRETANYNWEVLKTPLRFKEISAPNGATIPDDTLALYAKDKAGTSNLYFMDDAGVEHDLGLVGGQALTRVSDTNVTLTLGGTPATALLQPVSITVGWSGTLSLARGGTAADLSATGGAGKVLKQSSLGAAITVATLAASDIASGAALTKTDDTNVTLTLGGTPASALLVAASITVGWTGTLSVARGGTDIASYAVGDLLYASGSTTLSKLADVAAGSYLRSGGVTTAPVWSTLILPNAATANRIVYATSSNTLGESANLAYDGTDFLLGSGTRARMSGQNRFRYLQMLCSVFKSATQGITRNTWTTVTFDSEVFDTDTLHDTSTNNSRITVPIAGKYFVWANAHMDTTGTTTPSLVGGRVIKNGVATALVQGIAIATAVAGSGDVDTIVDVAGIVTLAANDYVELQMIGNTASNNPTVGVATRFGLVYVGE